MCEFEVSCSATSARHTHDYLDTLYSLVDQNEWGYDSNIDSRRESYLNCIGKLDPLKREKKKRGQRRVSIWYWMGYVGVWTWKTVWRLVQNMKIKRAPLPKLQTVSWSFGSTAQSEGTSLEAARKTHTTRPQHLYIDTYLSSFGSRYPAKEMNDW